MAPNNQSEWSKHRKEYASGNDLIYSTGSLNSRLSWADEKNHLPIFTPIGSRFYNALNRARETGTVNTLRNSMEPLICWYRLSNKGFLTHTVYLNIRIYDYGKVEAIVERRDTSIQLKHLPPPIRALYLQQGIQSEREFEISFSACCHSNCYPVNKTIEQIEKTLEHMRIPEESK